MLDNYLNYFEVVKTSDVKLGPVVFGTVGSEKRTNKVMVLIKLMR